MECWSKDGRQFILGLVRGRTPLPRPLSQLYQLLRLSTNQSACVGLHDPAVLNERKACIQWFPPEPQPYYCSLTCGAKIGTSDLTVHRTKDAADILHIMLSRW